MKADKPHQDVFKLQKENRDLRERLKKALERDLLGETMERFFGRFEDLEAEPPNWVTGPPPKRNAIARPTAMLGDGHWDEVVNPSEIEWMNGYDRQIALERLERFFRNTIRLGRDYLKGIDFDGIVVPIVGDCFSGNIHEELNETNEGTIFESLLEFLGPMVAGIRLLADYYGRVFLPCVTGNHTRRRRKPHFKLRCRDNFEWLFYRLLEREFSGDDRVSFLIPDGPDVEWPIWGVRYRMTHGDQFRGGSGNAGPVVPILLGDSRKKKRSQAAGRPYDFLCVGHWHTYMPRMRGVIVNGTLKGYDEYCYGNNFDYEKPSQSFWLTDPEDGVTIMAPIHVEGKDEPWKTQRRKELPEWV